jgi:hypothetical protein
MHDRPAATTLRDLLADLTRQSAWAQAEHSGVIRVAVRCFLDEAHAAGLPLEQVLVELSALTTGALLARSNAAKLAG